MLDWLTLYSSQGNTLFVSFFNRLVFNDERFLIPSMVTIIVRIVCDRICINIEKRLWLDGLCMKYLFRMKMQCIELHYCCTINNKTIMADWTLWILLEWLRTYLLKVPPNKILYVSFGTLDFKELCTAHGCRLLHCSRKFNLSKITTLPHFYRIKWHGKWEGKTKIDSTKKYIEVYSLLSLLSWNWTELCLVTRGKKGQNEIFDKWNEFQPLPGNRCTFEMDFQQDQFILNEWMNCFNMTQWRKNMLNVWIDFVCFSSLPLKEN